MALPRDLAPPQAPRDDLRPKSRACGPVGLRNAPAGAVQASSPAWVCYNAGPRFPRLAAGLPWFVGEGFIPPAGVPAAAGCGGMRASRPTAARGRVPFPFGRALAMVCRGGPWPSCGTLRRRGVCGTMRASSPTKVRYNRRAAACPFGRGPSVVRRGGIYPSRGCSRHRGVRRDEGIPPYGRRRARALPVWPGVRHGL